MSFSSQVKMELSQINNLAKKNQVDRELAGYLITGNAGKNNKKIKFSTESEYNINRFAKLLKNVNIEKYNIEIKGKIYTIEYSLNDEIDGIVFEKDKILFYGFKTKDEYLDKSFIRGVFLGSGYISNPEKKYHLEIKFSEEANMEGVYDLLKEYNIFTKKIQKEKSYSLYIKDGEEISKFLAFIFMRVVMEGVSTEEVAREFGYTRNNVNRLINCETANLAKTIKASQKQIEDIKFIKSKHKFSELPENLKIVANIRLEHPDASLTDLVNLLGNTISKSGMCHRLTALSKIANELRDK